MITKTEKYNNEELVGGIINMEDADWRVKQIIPLPSWEYLVVFERDDS